MLTRSRLTALILMIVLAFPPAVHSAPMGQAGCAGNLLRNPGFEEAFSARGAREVEVASAWEPWWHNGSEAETSEGFLRRPEYKPESLAAFGPRRIHSGNWAQKWFTTYATHTGGIFQRVEVPVDSIVTFTAWAQVWSSQDPNPDTVVNPGEYGVSVGIDPTGGTDGNSPNVVWSPEVVQYNTWINLKVEAKARAGVVTVFLRGRPEYRNKYNDSYWDDACLTAIPPTPRPTNTPPPTNTPQPTPTPTVTPTVTPTATARPGTIRVYAFQDYNGNGTRDEGDALLPGAVFTVTLASGRLVSAYTTDGLSEPRSFAGLEPGAYDVGANAPLGYMPVGANSWRVMVEPAGQTDVGLAATFIPTMTPTRRPTATVTPIAPTPTATPTPSQSAALGASLYNLSGLIVIAFAVGLIVGIYMLRRSRRAKRT